MTTRKRVFGLGPVLASVVASGLSELGNARMMGAGGRM